jgi:hypothetical protein
MSIIAQRHSGHTNGDNVWLPGPSTSKALCTGALFVTIDDGHSYHLPYCLLLVIVRAPRWRDLWWPTVDGKTCQRAGPLAAYISQ